MQQSIEVNVVAFREGELWVAQCIEFDIAARAATLNDVKKALKKAVFAEICINGELGRQGLEGLPPAPLELQKLFDEADHQVTDLKREKPRAGVRIRDVRLAA